MQVRKISNLARVEGIIFEIDGRCAQVSKYGRPEGEYIKEEILCEDVRLWEHIKPEEKGKNVSTGTLVLRAAEKICPDAKIVYYEIMQNT